MAQEIDRTALFRNDHHLSEEGVAAYAEALLDDQTGALLPELQAHIDACETCRREAIELYSLVANMPADFETEPEKSEKEKLPTSRIHPAWRWSLVALTALLAFWVFKNTLQTPSSAPLENPAPALTPEQLLSPQQQPEHPVAETQKPVETSPKPEARDLFAANFEPDEQLEGMVGEVLRSAGTEVVQPISNESFSPGSTVHFEWKQERATALQLILLDNQGKELLKKELNGANFDWTAPKRPGVYYWKLENADELLHVGKFTLR